MKKARVSKRKAIKLKKQATKEALVGKLKRLGAKEFWEVAQQDSSIAEALSLVKAVELEKSK